MFLEHNRLFSDASWNVVPFAMRHSLNLDSDWSHHFVDEIEFGSSYSGLETLRKAGKSVFSLEARRKIAEAAKRDIGRATAALIPSNSFGKIFSIWYEARKYHSGLM